MEENVEKEALPETAAPDDVEPAKRHNWTMIALVAVSILAALLLASTIALAVTGDFECRNGKAGWERQDRQGTCPMQGQGNQWRRQQRPFPPVNPQLNPKDQTQQNQTPQNQTPRKVVPNNQQQEQSPSQSQSQ